jgi:hypothetical protein
MSAVLEVQFNLTWSRGLLEKTITAQMISNLLKLMEPQR